MTNKDVEKRAETIFKEHGSKSKEYIFKLLDDSVARNLKEYVIDFLLDVYNVIKNKS